MTATLTVTPGPFPHLVVDGWWDPDLLDAVLLEFPDPSHPDWKRYDGDRERKLEGSQRLWGPRTWDLIGEIRKRGPVLAEAFGLPELHMETVGGGYHLIEPGGLLDVHYDFSRSPRTGRYRALNCLVYLNHGWQDPGGHLELWDATERQVDIAPEFGRTVVFATSNRSWHGHPVPASRVRRSVAAYFYTDRPPADYEGDHSTVWHPQYEAAK